MPLLPQFLFVSSPGLVFLCDSLLLGLCLQHGLVLPDGAVGAEGGEGRQTGDFPHDGNGVDFRCHLECSVIAAGNPVLEVGHLYGRRGDDCALHRLRLVDFVGAWVGSLGS